MEGSLSIVFCDLRHVHGWSFL